MPQSGINGYTGSVTKNYTITPVSMTEYTIELTGDTDLIYDGCEKKPVVSSVKNAATGTSLPDGSYDISYAANIDAGLAYVRLTGKDNYTGTAVKFFYIGKADISNAEMSLSKTKYNYPDDGFYTPKTTLTYNGMKLKEGTDYELEYLNNSEPGTTIVKVTGKRNYTGNIEAEYTIIDATSENPTESTEDPTESDEGTTDPTENTTEPSENSVEPTEDAGVTPNDNDSTPSEPSETDSPGKSEGSGATEKDKSTNYSTIALSNGAEVTYPITVSYSGINRKNAIKGMMTIRLNGEVKTIKQISVRKAKNVGTATITKITLSDGTKLKKLAIPVEIVKYNVRTEDIKSPVTEKKIKISIPDGKTINVKSKDVSINETNKTITFNTKNLTGTCSY